MRYQSDREQWRAVPWDWPHLTRAEITHSTLIGERQPIDLGTFDVGSLFIYKKESHVKNLDFKRSQKTGRFHKACGPHFFECSGLEPSLFSSERAWVSSSSQSPPFHVIRNTLRTAFLICIICHFLVGIWGLWVFVCVCVCVLRVCLFLCFGQAALRILVPRPGIETVLPELKVGVLTTESPGKSLTFEFWLLI